MDAPKPLVPLSDGSGRPYEENVKPLLKFKLPAEKNEPKYLLRYISLPTFIHMFYYKSFTFKSVVSYQDENECIYPYRIAGSALMASTNGKGGQGFQDYYHATQLERSRYFASCWFGSYDINPRETMKNYFSKDGVVVVFDRAKLVEAFNADISFHSSHLTDLKLYAYGSVIYYSTDDFVADVIANNEIMHPAFAKRKDYELEREYRFVVDIGKQLLKFDYLNQNPPYIKEPPKFDSRAQSISAKLPDDKSFNDIGLIKVIGCSEHTHSVLETLCRQKEVKFWQGDYSEDYIFKQETHDHIKVETWEQAVMAERSLLLHKLQRERRERDKAKNQR